MTDNTFESVQARTAERQRFEKFMAQHVAALMDFSRKYTSRLPSLEQELFIARALKAAWDRREEFVAGKENAGLLIWWDKCLRDAALSRAWWSQMYQDDVRKIRGVDLGR